MFDNRELAILTWTGLFFLGMLSIKQVRAALKDVARAAFAWKVFFSIAMYFMISGLVIMVPYLLGIIDEKMVGTGIIWLVFTGISLLFRLEDVLTGKPVFRSELVDVAGIGAMLAAFLGAKVFALPWELLIIPAVTLVAILRIFAERTPDAKSAALIFDALLAGFTIWLLWVSIDDMIRQGGAYDWRGLIAGFVIPVVLTVVTLGYLFALSCYAAYENIIARLGVMSDGQSTRLKPILGVALVIGPRPVAANGVTGRGWLELQEGTSVRDGARAAKLYLAQRAADHAKEELRIGDLKKYSGVDGIDERGRRLDRREFQETIKALEWLGTCHMGWYRNRNGSYDPALLARIQGLFDNYELPAEHGILMRVSADGQAWYGYRKTVTGWVLGIGASEPPPSQYFFDGPEPPVDFPGNYAGWQSSKPVNWTFG